MLLAPLVLVHLVLILVAVRGGLSAGEILDRTQGNVLWSAFYILFVVAAAVHAPIGLKNILTEWTELGVRTVAVLSGVFCLVLLILGLRAVAGVGGWL